MSIYLLHSRSTTLWTWPFTTAVLLQRYLQHSCSTTCRTTLVHFQAFRNLGRSFLNFARFFLPRGSRKPWVKGDAVWRGFNSTASTSSSVPSPFFSSLSPPHPPSFLLPPPRPLFPLHSSPSRRLFLLSSLLLLFPFHPSRPFLLLITLRRSWPERGLFSPNTLKLIQCLSSIIGSRVALRVDFCIQCHFAAIWNSQSYL